MNPPTIRYRTQGGTDLDVPNNPASTQAAEKAGFVNTGMSSQPTVDRTPAVSAYQQSLDAQTAATSPGSFNSSLNEAQAYAANQRQMRIDSINTTFAPRIAREKEEGDARLSRAAALNVKMGGIGDNTRVNEQKGLNEKAVQAIEDSKAMAIMDAFDKADELALKMAESAYNRSVKSAEANVASQKNKYDTAVSLVGLYGKGGVTLDSLKKNEPKHYQDIVNSTGLSDLQLASMINASSPTPQNVTTKMENGMLVMSYFDPQTKKPVVVSERLPEGVGAGDVTITQGDNGMIYMIRDGKVINNINAAKPKTDADTKHYSAFDFMGSFPNPGRTLNGPAGTSYFLLASGTAAL